MSRFNIVVMLISISITSPTLSVNSTNHQESEQAHNLKSLRKTRGIFIIKNHPLHPAYKKSFEEEILSVKLPRKRISFTPASPEKQNSLKAMLKPIETDSLFKALHAASIHANKKTKKSIAQRLLSAKLLKRRDFIRSSFRAPYNKWHEKQKMFKQAPAPIDTKSHNQKATARRRINYYVSPVPYYKQYEFFSESSISLARTDIELRRCTALLDPQNATLVHYKFPEN